MADLPAIDLYQLPDASLRRAPPHLGQSLLPADPGGAGDPARFAPGTVAMGAWAVVTSALVAIWAVAAVVGGGTWFPWWALIAIPWIWAVVRRSQRPGNSGGPLRCHIPGRFAPGRGVEYTRLRPICWVLPGRRSGVRVGDHDTRPFPVISSR